MTRPLITNRNFGIEIEFVGAFPASVARVLNSNGVNCHYEGYTHAVTDHWKVVTDSSLRDHTSRGSGEIVSPILNGQDGLQQLQKVCDVLDTIEGITVNRSCGLHIHLDANDMTVPQIQTLYNRYADYEAQIDLIMPRSRRGNCSWARSCKDYKRNVNNTDIKRKRELSWAADDRYRKINLTTLTKYGTLEFRQHSGTLNYTKISNWLSFLMQFTEKSIELANTTSVRISSRRPYHTIRTLLENNGYTMEWQRGKNRWVVKHGDYVELYWTNQMIDGFYDNARESSLNKSKLFYYLTDDEDLCLEEDWVAPTARAVAQTQVGEDAWLEGIDTQVTNYLNERKDELN